MASSKIKIEYAIDEKSVKVVSDSAINLNQKLRVLQKELLKGADELGDKFDLIRNEIKDTEDAIDKTKAMFGDFNQTLGMLPGPLGNVATSIKDVNDTFKVFGGFKTGAVRAQFKEFTGDIKDTAAAISRMTGLTAVYEKVQNTLNSVFGKTKTATDVASTGFKGLSKAIVATGVGAFAIALGYVAGNLDKITADLVKLFPWLSKIGEIFTSVKNAVTDFFGITSEGERVLEAQRKSIDKTNAALENEIAILEAQGATAEEIHKKKKQLIQNEIDFLKATLKEKGKLTDEEKVQYEKFITDLKIIEINYQKEQQKIKDDAAKEAAEKAKAAAQEALNRRKAENQALIDLELSRADVDLVNLKKLLDEKLRLENKSGAERVKARKEIEKILDTAAAGEIDRALALAKSQEELANAYLEKSDDVIFAIKEEQAQAKVLYELESKAIMDKIALYEKDSIEYQNLIITKNNLDAQYIQNQVAANKAIEEEQKNRTEKAKEDAKEQAENLKTEFWDKYNNDLNMSLMTIGGNYKKTVDTVTEAQNQLDEAYKKGLITQEEYTATTLENEALILDAQQQRVAAVNQLAASTGQLAQAMGEESAAGRVLIKVQQALALAGTALALVDAFKGLGKDVAKGFPTNIIAVASTLALIATMFTQAKQLFGKNPRDLGKDVGGAGSGAGAPSPTGSKFAMGGLLDGPSHSNGGIKMGAFELEGGEFVMNKRSTRSFLPVLNAMNEVGNVKGSDSNSSLIADLKNTLENQQTPIVKTYVVASDLYNQVEADKKIANLAKL